MREVLNQPRLHIRACSWWQYRGNVGRNRYLETPLMENHLIPLTGHLDVPLIPDVTEPQVPAL